MSTIRSVQEKLSVEPQIREKIVRVGVYIGLSVSALVWLVPILWMTLGSVKTTEQLISPTPEWIPSPVTLHWFIKILTTTPIIRWTVNTVIVALGVSVLVMVLDSLAAFSLTRLEWPGQKIIFSIILGSFMIPFVINLIPLYTVVDKLGFINTYPGIILPIAASPLGVFMLYQFFKDIPDELAEAAKLDGFSPWRRFLYITVPMTQSAITALGLFWFIWSWNAFLWPLVVMQKSSMYTLPIGLVTLQGQFQYKPAITLASSVIAAFPLFVLFVALQDKIIGAIRMQAGVG